MAQQIQFIYLTQSDFDGLANKENKLYFTSDTKRIYRGSDLYAATSFDQLNFSSIEASAITVNGSSVSLEGHTHSASEIDGLGAAISAATTNFSQNGHKHAIADVTNLSGIVSGITNTTVSKSSGSFNTLTVGGSNVSVEGHKHSISDVTGLSSALEQIVPIEFMTSSAFDALTVKDSNTIYFVDDNSIYKGDELYGATSFDQLEFSDIEARSITVNGSAVAIDGHTHAFNDITGLQSAIDGLSSIYAGTSHSHAISDITNLSTTLTGISESSLTKDTITGDIGNFRMLSVSGSANFAVNNVSANAVSVNGTPVSLEGHTHGVSEVTGLSDAISAATSGFASSQHSHSHADVTDFDSAVVTAGSSSFAPISHSHAISSITGLTASLSELSSSIQSLQSQIVPVQCITLAQYEALQPVDASTIYFISDGNRIYRGSVLYAATTFDQLTFSSIEASDITVNGSAVALEGHTHSFADVDGLSTALNGLASSGHTHGELTGITQTSISKATANFTTVSASTGTFNTLTTTDLNITSLAISSAAVSSMTVTNLNVTNTLKLNNKDIATQEYVQAMISQAIGQILASAY